MLKEAIVEGLRKTTKISVRIASLRTEPGTSQIRNRSANQPLDLCVRWTCVTLKVLSLNNFMIMRAMTTAEKKGLCENVSKRVRDVRMNI
jgi:hypothetical protein